MNGKIKILLVEDDLNMGFLLVDFLEANSFDVKLYRDGESGQRAFLSDSYDFVILDVMLPGKDGFSLAKQIREKDTQVPIVFLTARSMKPDKLKGFGLGADDYITKPFDEDELLCRIQAILSRSNKAEAVLPEAARIGSFSFQYKNQLLVHAGVERRLTPKENEVLQMLCCAKNNLVRRDQILESVWGDNDYFNGRSLDVFIAKLRKYLSPDPTVEIENVPKVGYVLKD